MVTNKKWKKVHAGIQKRWQHISHRQHTLAQPEGRERAKVGIKGEGDCLRIVVRPKEEFVIFRYHDIGRKGHVQRLAGKRHSGTWDTQTWLVSKHDAHVEHNSIIPDTQDARKILETLGSKPIHVRGDIFKAKERRAISESRKPTPEQKKVRMENVGKARQARL